MSPAFIEWFGYGASVVVGVSLLMTSVVRLRWINLAGSLLFTAYGLLISAYPVALLNFSIALINVWHLARIHRRRDRLVVTLDYVAPEYRDFKVGRHVFIEDPSVWRGLGVNRVAADAPTPAHRDYLERMGFKPGKVEGREMLVRSV